MSAIEKIPGRRTRSPLPWVLAGGVLAPVLILLFSYMHADASMRILPVLIFVTLVGAIAGRFVFAINERSKVGRWWPSTSIAVILIVYILLVFAGFIIARLGPL